MHGTDPLDRFARREFLAAGAAFGAAALGGNARALARPGDDADVLDAALTRLHAGYPSTNVHRANHVPMVVEALATLGRADAVVPWLDENLERFEPDVEPQQRVDVERWREF